MGLNFYALVAEAKPLCVVSRNKETCSYGRAAYILKNKKLFLAGIVVFEKRPPLLGGFLRRKE
jgi:hypothetical protein